MSYKYSDIGVQFGGDPEFFIGRKTGNKTYEVKSADLFLPPKTKKLLAGRNSKVFFDGVQAEINPYQNGCNEAFIGNIQSCMMSVWNEVYKSGMFKKPSDILLLPYATVPITKDTLKGRDKECMRFGCAPDYNVYDNEKRIKYPSGKNHMLRYSGGHIHYGFESASYSKFFSDAGNMSDAVVTLDILLGLPCVGFSHDKGERLRRKLYGRAGSHRIQAHGLEYRVLSSFWMASPILASLITKMGRNALSVVYSRQFKNLMDRVGNINEVRNIINDVDRVKARKFYSNVVMPFWKTFSCDRIVAKKVKTKSLIRYMMNHGYKDVFKPFKTKYYWGVNGNRKGLWKDLRYGVEQYTSDWKSNKFTLKEYGLK